MKILAVITLVTMSCATGTVQSQVSMQKVAAGERSGIAEARTVVVRSDAEWQELWSEARVRKPFPNVDFSTRMIVGVFVGTRPTSGYSVRIVEVRAQENALLVAYAEHRPSPRASVMQVLTAPFELVSVPRNEGEVRFERAAATPGWRR